MSSICRSISLDFDLINIILQGTPKNLGDITSTLLKNKSCSAFILEKEYLGEGIDEVQQVEELIQSNEPIESDLIRSNP